MAAGYDEASNISRHVSGAREGSLWHVTCDAAEAKAVQLGSSAEGAFRPKKLTHSEANADCVAIRRHYAQIH